MSKIRILIVDDNLVNLAALEQDLKYKYEVIPVKSGDRAIRFLRREAVDLILLDIQMPELDGIDTLKKIREMKNGITVPVIFLTSNTDKFNVIEGMKLGIMDYIVKPFNTEDLQERIEHALRRHVSLPIGGDELFERLTDIQNDTRSGRLKMAATKTEELMGYQLDEDVSGRMNVVKTKLEAGNREDAGRMLDRIVRLLEKRGQITKASKRKALEKGEIMTKVLYAIDALENFDTKDATEKLNELLTYPLPDAYMAQCSQALDRLQEYDDEEAEKLLHGVLAMM
jgi:DNA-binding response OmpR family regulator